MMCGLLGREIRPFLSPLPPPCGLSVSVCLSAQGAKSILRFVISPPRVIRDQSGDRPTSLNATFVLVVRPVYLHLVVIFSSIFPPIN